MKKQIMKKAWMIAKDGQKEFGGSVKSYLPESLKIAWKQAKTGETKMKVMITEKDFNFNQRRYGAPWAAKISVDESGKSSYDFIGQFTGGRTGEGELIIMAETSDIIAIGQKDNRGNKTENDWFKVSENCPKNVEFTNRNQCEFLESIQRSEAIKYLMAR